MNRSSAVLIVVAVAVAAVVVLAGLVFLPGLRRARPAGTSVGEATIDYASSVDGFPLSYSEWLPAGYDANQSYPMAVYLHHIGDGSGQTKAGGFPNDLGPDPAGVPVINAASSNGFVLIAPNTRTGSGFYINSNYTGPQEQDVLDAVAHEESLRSISKVYLFGFSMGAIGTYSVGLHHPTMFAGLGVIASAPDTFEAIAHLESNAQANAKAGNAIQSLLTITHGQWPNQSAYAQQLISYLSVARFDAGAFANLPVYAVQGSDDPVLPNNPFVWPYQQANFTYLTSSCVVAAQLAEPANCTTPLATLHAAHPSQYLWRFVYCQGGGHSLAIVNAADMFQFWLNPSAHVGLAWSEWPSTTPTAPP